MAKQDAKCSDLDDETHELLKYFGNSVKPKTGQSNRTPTHAAEDSSISYRRVKEHLADLEELGFVVYKREHARVLILRSCAFPRAWYEPKPIRPRKRAPKKPAKMNAHDLAVFFRHEVERRGEVVVDISNLGGLRKTLSRWIREEGIPPEVIHAMIIDFAATPKMYTRPGAPAAWRAFLASRQDLLNRAKNSAKSEEGWDSKAVEKMLDGDPNRDDPESSFEAAWARDD
jgi:hypothetical protein